jgi:glycosyltransferase involved in cell wall biosynthesis
VPPGDSAALADAIRRLAGDEAARRSLGAAGRRYVEAHYSRTGATRVYDRLIVDLGGRQTGRSTAAT